MRVLIKSWLLGTTALALLTAAADAPATAQQKTIKIGFISTFSGPAAAIGKDMRNSFELGLDQVGRKLGGMPVEVIYEDDQIKPDVGVQKTQKLIESDHVDFIVGYIWSNVAVASLKPLVDSKTITVMTNAGASEIAGPMCSPYVFSTSWQNDQTPAAIGTYMNQKGVKTAFLMGPNYIAGKDMLHGVTVDLQRQDRRPGADALARPARFLRRTVEGPRGQARRDLRLLSGRRRHSVHHPIRAKRAEGTDPALYRVHHRRTVAAAAERPRDRRPRRAELGQRPAERRQQEVRRRLQGEISTPRRRSTAPHTYDAVALLDSAVTAVNGDLSDKEGMRKAMEKADFKSVRGDFKFGNNHIPIQNFYLQDAVKNADGSYALHTVAPSSRTIRTSSTTSAR